MGEGKKMKYNINKQEIKMLLHQVDRNTHHELNGIIEISNVQYFFYWQLD